MKDEIKEILKYIQKYTDEYETTNLTEIRALQMGYVDTVLLLDYITNLQTIEQQYSAILSENAELENKITNLQEENKELQTANEYHQNIIQEYETMKSPNHLYGENVYLRGREASLHKQFQDYKTRNEKAVELISKEFLCYDNESDEYIQGKKAINILQGKSDE